MGTLGFQCPLHLIEHNLFDDWGHINGNPFLTRFDFPCLAVQAVEVVGTGVDCSLQDVVNVAHVEHLSSTLDASIIEVIDNGFHAQWPTDAISIYVEVIDPTHQCGFVLVNGESFLDPVSPFLRLYCAISEWWFPAIPIALAGIFQHRTGCVFCGLCGMVSIKSGKHAANEITLRIIGNFLRHRDQGNFMPFQTTAISFELIIVPKETAE
nr:hypothetical protein [Cohaesibacter marisflavi]